MNVINGGNSLERESDKDYSSTNSSTNSLGMCLILIRRTLFCKTKFDIYLLNILAEAIFLIDTLYYYKM